MSWYLPCQDFDLHHLHLIKKEKAKFEVSVLLCDYTTQISVLSANTIISILWFTASLFGFLLLLVFS